MEKIILAFKNVHCFQENTVKNIGYLGNYK